MDKPIILLSFEIASFSVASPEHSLPDSFILYHIHNKVSFKENKCYNLHNKVSFKENKCYN